MTFIVALFFNIDRLTKRLIIITWRTGVRTSTSFLDKSYVPMPTDHLIMFKPDCIFLSNVEALIKKSPSTCILRICSVASAGLSYDLNRTNW